MYVICNNMYEFQQAAIYFKLNIRTTLGHIK